MTLPTEDEVRGLVEQLRRGRLIREGKAFTYTLGDGIERTGREGDIREVAHPKAIEAADLIESQQRAYLVLSERVRVIRAALVNARKAIASLDEDALGWGQLAFTSPDDRAGRYALRDELLAELDAALSQDKSVVEGEG